VTALRLQVQRRKGIIAELAATVNEADAGIDNIKVDERNAQLSTVVIEISVKNRVHLARVVRKLRALPNVSSINRIIT
jgi:GTP pyrophosphokinase